MTQPSGVVFPRSGPASGQQRRSTGDLGRHVVAAALRSVDVAGADRVLTESDWRHAYPTHFRHLLQAGLGAPADAQEIASAGLAALHRSMQWADGSGEAERPLTGRPLRGLHPFGQAVLQGSRPPERFVSVPFTGDWLRGQALLRQLDAWVLRGVMEPDTAVAVRRVMDHPEWLRLPGRTAVVLGAGAEMGPLGSLLRWGADVAAIDLPRPALWRRLLAEVRDHAGRLIVPVPRRGAACSRAATLSFEATGARGSDRCEADLADRAGIDLLHDLPSVAVWIADLSGDLVLGNYVYAEGARNVRVCTAVDDLTYRLLQRGGRSIALAFLGTPTDVFAVPADAVAAARAAYAQRVGGGGLGRVLRSGSRHRLLTPNYGNSTHGYTNRADPQEDRLGGPQINDSIIPQQGPNYLLAKRIQRWRALEARTQGHLVSFGVAPPTRTRSVVSNRALAAAYAGAHRFGVEVFEPATSSTLMAILLVHDLYAGGPAPATPWEAEARHAVHGGLWRCPYAPRSALGLAALLGLVGRQY
ncbi:MAG: hypothetical protein Q4P32_02675 [Micrococcales bacterium]|nr:hypothetical protein [Micrococcales bacterium]